MNRKDFKRWIEASHDLKLLNNWQLIVLRDRSREMIYERVLKKEKRKRTWDSRASPPEVERFVRKARKEMEAMAPLLPAPA